MNHELWSREEESEGASHEGAQT